MKVPFEIVDLEVTKMYKIDISRMTDEQVEKHFANIKEYVLACGWSPEQYVEKLFGFNKSN